MTYNTSHYLLFALSLAGFFLSLYIYCKRRQKEKLVCVIGDDCNKVVYSKYSSQFGIPNELFGMIYYVIIFVSSVVFWVNPVLLTIPILWARTILVIGAAAFSVYLTGIQIFVLKELCEYCLIVNLINLILFLALFMM